MLMRSKLRHQTIVHFHETSQRVFGEWMATARMQRSADTKIYTHGGNEQ